MAFRMTTLAFALLCLFLLTEARTFDWLPTTDNGSCQYVGKCTNDSTATEDCMTECANNGFTSAGAMCIPFVKSTCCCLKDKKSTVNPTDDDQSCHYLDGCADRNECAAKCNDGGFQAGAKFISVTSVNCCCLKDQIEA